MQDPPYGPSAFASAMQIDGRFIITGGEYNYPGNGYDLQLTISAPIYDPVANTWTPIGHPDRLERRSAIRLRPCCPTASTSSGKN